MIDSDCLKLRGFGLTRLDEALLPNDDVLPELSIRDVSNLDWCNRLANDAVSLIPNREIGWLIVRATLFAKSTRRNWSVPWHQDTTISVAQKQLTPGYSAWSQKSGVFRVRPPIEVLRDMITVRIHLDDHASSSGPLEIVDGSHQLGILSGARRSQVSATDEPTAIRARKGDVLVMSPLVLHRSRSSESEGMRRVLHLELSRKELPGGLAWRTKVPIPRVP